MRVLAVAPGPAEHGVVLHARAVARLLGRAGVQVEVARSRQGRPADADVVHVQFTDVLWGDDVGAAATTFERWAARVRRPVVVTLHDVPGADRDRARDARRRDAYRRVVTAADAIVVSAAHEAEGARAFSDVEPVVVPLPVEPLAPPGPAPWWADQPSVVVLGFVYPGKGHDTALDVVARSATGARLVAAGGPSPGHEGLVAHLRRAADARGVELVVTGLLPEPDLHAAVRAATVPLAAYRTLGASGSLATWTACGRRPVVSSTPHARELLARRPGSLLLAAADELPAAVGAALADPARTWLAQAVEPPDVAAAHLAVLRRAVGSTR